MKSLRITKGTTVHLQGNINVWTEFHDSLFSSFDISLKTPNVNLMVALFKKSGVRRHQ